MSEVDRKPLWKAVWDGDIKRVDMTYQCFCVGPQDGNTKCPCQLRNEAFMARLDRSSKDKPSQGDEK